MRNITDRRTGKWDRKFLNKIEKKIIENKIMFRPKLYEFGFDGQKLNNMFH